MNKMTDNDRTVWNVKLWIFNAEPLYRMAIECLRATSGPSHLHDAADLFRDNLGHDGITKTPDGHRYTTYAVIQALRDIRDELEEIEGTDL